MEAGQKSCRGKFHRIGNDKHACVYECHATSRVVGIRKYPYQLLGSKSEIREGGGNLSHIGYGRCKRQDCEAKAGTFQIRPFGRERWKRGMPRRQLPAGRPPRHHVAAGNESKTGIRRGSGRHKSGRSLIGLSRRVRHVGDNVGHGYNCKQ